jgi:6-phosphogluconolactonase
MVVTPNGRFAYASNAGSSSVSSYAIGHDGSIALLAAQAALMGANAGTLHAAVSTDGQQVHVLASRALQVVSYAIDSDGSLTKSSRFHRHQAAGL